MSPSAPTPSSSLTNKPASASSSLYQSCLQLRDRLYSVPGLEPYLLQAESSDSPGPSLPSIGSNFDPVSQLWNCFRLGTSLCVLFNALLPETPLKINTEPINGTNINTCKASVYHFLIACKKELGCSDEDLFTITQLYQDDTNGFVKVTKTVAFVLGKLEERNLLVKTKRSLLICTPDEKPKDNRAKVVTELLQTERKYVEDMEILQNYVRELSAAEILPADTIHSIFSNLNVLVDFQRRFLIGLEGTSSLPQEQQRIGLLFTQMEEGFSVYEPFCANYAYASDLALEEAPKLAKLAHLVEPSYELPSLLIKPIQRICKYPLLLKELLKYTDTSHPYYPELETGMESIKRVTDRVNERRRKQENEQVVLELERRVEDWKGHSVAGFGSLLLEDCFNVIKGDVEREYHVYLFERILLCCKEIGSQKKTPKNISKKPKKRLGLQLKGRIFINNITEVVPSSGNGVHSLQVYWRGDMEQEYFCLRCKNDENLNQWYSQLSRLIEEARKARKSRPSDAGLPSLHPGHPSNVQLASLQNNVLHYRNKSSDEGSFPSDVESIDEEGDTLVGRTISHRSRSTTAEVPFTHRSRFPITPNPSSFPMRGINGTADYQTSHFSPLVDSPALSMSRGSSSYGSGYPFPRQTTPAPPPSTGAEEPQRYTAPPVGRTISKHSNVATMAPPSRPGSSQNRLRSASSPNIHHVPLGNRPAVAIPPVPPTPSTYGVGRNESSSPGSPYASSRPLTSASSSTAASNQPITPVHTNGPSQLKVKVNYLDDKFCIVIAPGVGYNELLCRVEKKIRLCGGDRIGSLRMKYIDEDGDFITINSDEDVQMAIESRASCLPADHASTINLFVSS